MRVTQVPNPTTPAVPDFDKALLDLAWEAFCGYGRPSIKKIAVDLHVPAADLRRAMIAADYPIQRRRAKRGA